MSQDNLHEIHCFDCGISFLINKAVVQLWTANRKSFWCPNGHSLYLIDETQQGQALASLRAKVDELQQQLFSTTEELNKQNQRVVELTMELEIWKPSREDAAG
jgi:hypothetical protein